MTALLVEMVGIGIALIVIALLVGTVRLVGRQRERRRDSVTPERFENLEQFVR